MTISLGRGGSANGSGVVSCAECTDLWTWFVLYNDESELFECEGTGVRHAAWADINVPAVKSMVLLSRREGFPQVVVDVSQPDVRPIFFRRRYKELSLASGEEQSSQTIHCLGFERSLGDAVVSSFVFVFEDGSILLSPDRNAV